MKFRNYYLGLTGLLLTGIAFIAKLYSPTIAGTVVEVFGNLLLASWLTAEAATIYKSRQIKNTAFTAFECSVNAISSTAQILRLIPQLQPDKNGQLNEGQKAAFVCIGVAYSAMWLTGMTYLNTQIEAPSSNSVEMVDKSQMIDEEETIRPNNSSTQLIQ